MRPVQQTRLGRDGNCYAACIASLLDVPLSAVPDLDPADPASDVHWQNWLVEHHGLVLIRYPPDALLPGEYVILTVSSRLADRTHAVVGLNGQVAWDPHPEPWPPSGPLHSQEKLTPLLTVEGWGWYVNVTARARSAALARARR